MEAPEERDFMRPAVSPESVDFSHAMDAAKRATRGRLEVQR
jgi:hypothetical protein